MEYLMFPTSYCDISQTAGVDRNHQVILTSYSHFGNKANDIIPKNGKFYAPCRIQCVFHARLPDGLGGMCAYISIFNSVYQVRCADGSETAVTLLCLHGGKNVKTAKDHVLRVGDTFQQHEYFYTMGTDNGIDSKGNAITIGAHIHFQVQKGHDNHVVIRYNYYTLPYDCFIEDVFFSNNTVIHWIGDLKKWCFPYVLTSLMMFDPIGKADGWYELYGERYYVKNEKILTGWQFLPKENNSSILYDFFFSGRGVMQTNSWVNGKDAWYYVGKDGRMVMDEWINDPLLSSSWYHVDAKGKMQKGWFLDKNQVYYFLNDGRFPEASSGLMMRSRWIASALTAWYFVRESGMMAADMSLFIHGKKYIFDVNGRCLNP